MKPETIMYRLKMKGYTLASLAKEIGVPRQTVWYVVHEKYQENITDTDKARQKIREILG